jgi:hypothetical protein
MVYSVHEENPSIIGSAAARDRAIAQASSVLDLVADISAVISVPLHAPVVQASLLLRSCASRSVGSSPTPSGRISGTSHWNRAMKIWLNSEPMSDENLLPTTFVSLKRMTLANLRRTSSETGRPRNSSSSALTSEDSLCQLRDFVHQMKDSEVERVSTPVLKRPA